MSHAESSLNSSSVMRRVRRHILPAALLLYTFNYIDRAAIGYAQLGMSSELGISVATYGTIAAIFFVAYTVLEVPSNMIMKRVGARIWLARIAVSWGVITVLTGFVQDATHLYIARIALGVAEAGLYPGLLLFLTYWFREEERGQAFAQLSFAQPIALIVGSATAGVILDQVDWLGVSSWRWVFILQGLPSILLGIWIWLTLADHPRRAEWLTESESRWLEEQAGAYQQGDGSASPDSSAMKVIRKKSVLHLALINLGYAIGLNGMTYFLPQVVKQINPEYSATNLGLAGALPYLCGAVAMLLVARKADALRNHKAVVIATLGISILGLLTTVFFRGMPALGMLGLCLLAIGVFSYLGPFWALTTQYLDRSQVAVGLATINSIAAAGGFFGPYVIGKTAANHDVTLGLLFPAGSMIAALLLLAALKPVERSHRGPVAT